VLFFDTDYRRLGAIFFDGAGRHAAIDSEPVALSGGLYKWLDSTFGKVLR